MPVQIGNSVLEAYLHCTLKGYLKLTGQPGDPLPYDELLARRRETVRQTVTASQKHQEYEVRPSRSLSISDLKVGDGFILDVIIEYAALSLHFDALKRIAGKSKLGKFHYIPVLFCGSRQIRRVQKLLLTVLGAVLGSLQGKRPSVGLVMFGKECRTRKVQLDRQYREAGAVIQSLIQMSESSVRPPLILNDHCDICEFRRTCQREATKIDSLSLLRGIQPKEIKRYARRGIFTTSQLAHTFRPRRRGKRVEPKVPKREHALHAMAVRDRTIYVLGTPTLPTRPVKAYLDVEADPENNYVYLIGMVVCDSNGESTHSFWADNEAEERHIFGQFLQVLSRLKDFDLYCYGSYEKDFLKRIQNWAGDTAQLDGTITSLTNVLSVIYRHIYFPTWSNGLKDIGSCLGYSWQSPDASGI